MLEATGRVIARRGLDRTRYSDIAKESGVAVSTLQHAFGRLEQILDLALEYAQELDAQFLDHLPLADESTPWERIETFVTGALASPAPPGHSRDLRATLDGWLLWIELWRASARDPQIAAQTASAYTRWWSAAEAIIADGQADGSFTTDAPAADLAIALNALVDGSAVGLLLRDGQGDLDAARRIALLGTRRILQRTPDSPGDADVRDLTPDARTRLGSPVAVWPYKNCYALAEVCASARADTRGPWRWGMLRSA